MSKYRLLKDLPYVKAGAIYELDVPDGTYVCDSATAEFREGVKWDGLGIAAVENNPEWFQEILPEENKSNDSFQWTDELVGEFSSNPTKWGTTTKRAIDNFKVLHLSEEQFFSSTPKPQAENKPETFSSDKYCAPQDHIGIDRNGEDTRLFSDRPIFTPREYEDYGRRCFNAARHTDNEKMYKVIDAKNFNTFLHIGYTHPTFEDYKNSKQ